MKRKHEERDVTVLLGRIADVLDEELDRFHASPTQTVTELTAALQRANDRIKALPRAKKKKMQ